MKTSKKILAIALSVLMIISVLPFAAFADELPQATVTTLPKSQITNVPYYEYGTGATGATSFDMGYKFVAQDDATSVQSSPYKQWHCDYVLSSTTDINAGDITIGGQFDAYSPDAWVTITPDSTIPAGAEIRLLETMFGDEITYATICSQVQVFKCAVKTNNEQIKGDDLKVELRLYETVLDPESGKYVEDPTAEPHVLEDVDYEYGTTMPGATVTELTGDALNITTIDGQSKTLDKGFLFVADDDATTVQQSAYKNWSADYVITTDKDVPAGSVTIAGQSDHHSANWVTVTPTNTISANTETRLLKDVLGEGVFTYEDICTLVQQFKCGAIANDFTAKDIEMNVEFRLYETVQDPETGKYVEKVGGEVLNVEDVDYTFEEPAKPTATVTELTGDALNITTIDGQSKTLDKGFKFTADDDAVSVQSSAYKNWSADYVIKADRTVPAGSIIIAGQSDHHSPNWVTLTPDQDIPANTEVRLLKTFLGEDVFTYEDICTLVNEFQCGAIAKTFDAKDIEMTVELRIFETQLDPETGKYVEVEGGKELAIEDIEYTFEEPALPQATVTELAAADITGITAVDFASHEAATITLDKGYKFTAQDDAVSVQESAYKTYSADYVIWADEDIPAYGVTIAGQYDENDAAWVSLTPSEAIPANTEVRLLKTLLGEGVYTYEDICTLVQEFNCGVKSNLPEVAGTNVNVELRIFETVLDPETGKYVEKEGGQSFDITDIEYELEEPQAEAHNGSSLTLGDRVSFNAYLDADAYGINVNEAVVKLTYNHNADISKAIDVSTDIIPLTDATKYVKEGSYYNGTYKLSFKMTPAQYADDVTIELYANAQADAPIYAATTNVKTLCERVIEMAETDNAYANYAALCKALADYCQAAQVYFQYEAPESPAYYNPAVTSLDADEMNVGGTNVTLENTGYSFTVVSGLEVNIFCAADTQIQSISIDSTKGAGSISAAMTSKSGLSCVNIKGIASGNIDNVITLETSNGEAVLAATNIAKAIVASSNNINFVNLARALYLYSVQASAYFGC
ncbi:MAG: hypothetical protein IJJ41_02870 [Clostridia bacterium]|nr:hypothetical protein [Clostridia bacterium]MBR0413780.1 hypothetical protein [Clostridia bacterium]